MKILFIPYGTEKAPATRYRVIQYLKPLAQKGIEGRVFSAISRFSTGLMIKSPDFKTTAKCLYYIYVFLERIVRFFYILLASRNFDVIFLQRTTFPFKLEIFLRLLNPNIVFDIDDAIYLPDAQRNDILTRVKKYIKEREVAGILRISRIVIVENEYIKNFVTPFCNNIFKIPGPIDTERFFVQPQTANKSDNNITIGWIGSPATTPYLHMLDNVFRIIKRKYNFVNFKFVGLGNYANQNIQFKKVEWNYETEVGQLQSFDIGVMPMPDDEWTRGKLGCKMLQYMAVGVPAVVSYTPTNAEIIKNGENGFFVTDENEWIKTLSLLIEDEKLRRSIGKKGREKIEEKCSLRYSVDKLVTDIFSKI